MSVRLRLCAFALLVLATVAVGLPTLYGLLLPLDAGEAAFLRFGFAAWVLLTGTVLIAVILVGLRGIVAGMPPISKDDARRRVLELPGRLASTAVMLTELAVAAALAVGLRANPADVPLIVGLAVCTGAILSLLAVPLYAFARAALGPLALALAEESSPRGRPLTLGLQLGYTVVAVASAALVPAALFGVAHLDQAALAQAQQRAHITASRLARAARDLELPAAISLCTRTALEGDEWTLLRAPSGTLLPEDEATELAGTPYVEVPLEGALEGGAVRVAYAAHPAPRGPLFAVTIALLLGTLAVARALGNAIGRELTGLTRQIQRLAAGEPPGEIEAVSTLELRRVATAVNDLLERIPHLTVASFVAAERANDARRMKSQFLANMSHDLRSPLNSILGFSELLLRKLEGELTPAQEVLMAAVHATGLRLLRLLDEILDTAKVESGKMELHRQSTPAAALLTQALAEVRRARTRTATDRIAVELQPGMGSIYVDPLRFTQAVAHLINHALDLAPAGTPVALRAREHESAGERTLVLEVEHLGDPGDPGHLFDGFAPLSGQPGLHLALPLARRLIELHGGRLELATGTPVPDEAAPRTCIRAALPLPATRRPPRSTTGRERVVGA